MATNLTLTGPSSLRWSSGGLYNWGDYLLGYTDGRFAIIRYSFTIDTPLTKLSLKFTDEPTGNIFSHYGGKDYRGNENGSDFGFYISSKDHTISKGFTKHSLGLPGMTNELSSGLRFAPGGHKEIIGELDLSKKPLPSGTYYLYIHNFTKSYGCMIWSARITDTSYKPPASECTYETYTAPSAPSNFKFITGFKDTNNVPIVLSTGFTVKWDAAQDGVNNPVTGYKLFLNGVSIKTVEGKDATSYSYEFTKEQDFQGENITVSIRTIGKAESAKYSEMKEITGRVNTRPTKPILSKNYSGNGFYEKGTVEITISNPQDTDIDNDPISYQYKIGTNGAWENIDAANLKVKETLTDTTTFTFRAYDNKEYSYGTSLTINKYTLNIKEVGKIGGDYGVEEITYNVSRKCQVKASYKDEKDKKTKEKTFNFNSGNNTINLITELGFSQTEIKLTFYPKDSNGAVLNLGDNGFQTEELGKTPAQPTKNNIEVFDSHNGTNIINNSEYHCFFKEIAIKIPKFDYRIEKFNKTITFSDKDESVTGFIDKADFIDKGDFYLLKATFDVAQETTGKNLSLKLGDYVFDLGTYYRIINFPFSGLKSNNMGELIYTTNDNKPAPLRVSFSCDISELEQSYGLKDIEGKWQLQLLYGNNRRLVKNNLTPDTSSSPGTGTLSWGDITQAALEELGIPVSQYNGNKTFMVMVGVINAYGETIYDYCEQIYDFNKEFELTYFNFKFQDDNGELKSPDEDYNFVEGMTIRATYKIKKWQAETVAFKIQTNKGKTTLFSFSDTSSNSLSGTESNEISIDFKIPKITGSSETWDLCLYNDKVSRSVGTAYNTFPVNDKSVSLTGFDYSHNDNETGTYTLKSFTLSSAAEGELAYFLIFAGNEKRNSIGNDNTVTISDNFNPLAPLEDGSEKDSVIGSLLITETVRNSGYTLTKEWHSNTVVIYNILPTISYRKNHIGINTLSPSAQTDSIIYMGVYGNRDKIYFVNSNSDKRILDVETGGLSGFIFDCGSWDGTPGGFVPSVPDAPSGLARIAYTGLVSDLIEDENTVLILNANEFDFS